MISEEERQKLFRNMDKKPNEWLSQNKQSKEYNEEKEFISYILFVIISAIIITVLALYVMFNCW